MEAGTFPAVLARNQAIIRDLSSGLAAAFADVEQRDAGYAISALAQGLSGLLEAGPEGAEDTGRDHRYAGFWTCSVRSVKMQHAPGNSPAILVAFPIDAFYTMTPKGENSSLEVRRLSHGKQSAAI